VQRRVQEWAMSSTRLLVAALLLTFQSLALASDAQAVRLRWSDAGDLVRGKRITVITTGGATYKGTVRVFYPDFLALAGGSEPRIRRAEIAEIRLTEYVGNGRRMGRRLGGAIGLAGGLRTAVVVGLDETSTHKGRDKAVAAVLAAGWITLGLLAGHYIGRQADKEVTVIRIIPE